MGIARYWSAQTVTSNLFRFITWIFLRVIPFQSGKFIVPLLYAFYLATWLPALVKNGNYKAAAQSEGGKSPFLVQTNDKKEKDSLEREETKPALSSLKELPHGTLSTIAFSLPTTSATLKVVAILINTFLLLCTADVLTRPTREPASDVIFTRLGAVDPDGVKVVVRWPEVEGGSVRVVWRQAALGTSDLDKVWKNGPVIPLRNETDWVGVGRIGGLWPSTAYEYRLAYPNSTLLPYPADAIRFRTFPDPRLTTGNHFKFVVSSCIMPNFPYLPFKGDRIKGFDLLADYLWPAASISPVLPSTATDVDVPIHVLEKSLEVHDMSGTVDVEVTQDPATSSNESNITHAAPTAEHNDTISSDVNKTLPTSTPSEPATITPEPLVPNTEFMLLLGDFIYADVPWYRGDDVETYRRLYRRMYASPSFRKVYEILPVFNIYDDHDFIDNFEGQSNISASPFLNASSAYFTYNGQANYAPITKGEHHYEFRYGDVAFYVLDTRLHRSGHAIPEGEKKTMLGEQQLSSLYEWLDKVNTTTTFKFIISSVPFTSLWGYDAQVDSWAGYRDERDELLAVLGTVPNVFVLSGDRHEFAAIEYLGGSVVEFSTSPLSMFYIPIVKTLKSRSKRYVEKSVQKVDVDETGREIRRDEAILVPEEQVLKYLPLGNYKWSSFEIDTTDRHKPTLKLEVVINGRTEWRHTIIGKPIPLKASSALGTQIARGLRGALSKIRLSPTKWF